jgi:putative transposase
VKTLLHSVYDQADAEAVHAQFDRVLDALETKLPNVAAHLDRARTDVLAFTRELWRQIWSNNPQERLNREIRRRTDVVGILPDRNSLIRLVGAVLAEQHDEWTEARRYLGLEALARARTAVTAEITQEATTELVPALSASPTNRITRPTALHHALDLTTPAVARTQLPPAAVTTLTSE